MMRFSRCLIFLLFLTISANAQTPQFIWADAITSAGIGFHDRNTVIQSFYYASDFPGASAGPITSIYIRSNANQIVVGSPSVYNNFTVKIGYTDSCFHPSIAGLPRTDTFKTGLTTIFTAPVYNAAGADTIGKWLRFPVAAGLFNFDPNKNFTVEFSYTSLSNGFYATANMKNMDVSKARTAIASHLYPYETNIASMDLGFDQATASVNNIANTTSFNIYPNPNNGKFNITFDAQRPINTISVSVSSITGQQLLQKQYHHVGSKQFSETIDVSTMPQGIYFVKSEADGAVFIKRVIVQ